MMNVTIMKMLIEPFENGEDTIAHDLLRKWKRDNDILKQGRASANFIFGYNINGDSKILRVTPGTERTVNQILAELDFIEHLANQNIPVNTPIPSLEDNLVESLEFNGVVFHAVSFQKMPGKHIDLLDMTSEQLFHFGEMVAKFHEASLTFSPHPERRRRDWGEDFANAINWLRGEKPFIENGLLEMKKWVESLNFTKENNGLIHYDFCTDNLLWEDDTFSIIDLDDAAYYPFIADFSFGIDEIREYTSVKREFILNHFINGYKSIREVSENWRFEFNQFQLVMDLLKYARLYRSYQDTDPNEDLPWMKKMRARHMKNLEEDYKRIEELLAQRRI